MHTVCHVEFDSVDMDRSQAFFEGLFGWTFQEFMGGEMRVFASQGVHVGGLTKKDRVEPGRSPSVWFDVADIDSLLARVEGLGGSIIEAKMPVPGVGWSALVADPDGSPVGLVQHG